MQNGNQDVGVAAIQQYLSGVDYPVNKPNLLQHADDEGAPEEVLALLRTLPDSDFSSLDEVTEAVGNH